MFIKGEYESISSRHDNPKYYHRHTVAEIFDAIDSILFYNNFMKWIFSSYLEKPDHDYCSTVV